MDETKVLLIIPFNGFQHIEYGITKKLLEDADFTVVTASDKVGIAVAKDGSTASVDISYEKIVPNNYIGIIFIGGPGAIEHLDNHTSYKIIQSAVHQNIPVGAICIATRILARSGVLKGKHATGYNEDKQLDHIYKEHHIKIETDDVVIDDNIVTATGPGATQKFAEMFIHVLQKKQSWG